MSFSPYIYIFDNPTNIVDVDGRGPGGGDPIQPRAAPYDEPGGSIGSVGIGIGIITGSVAFAEAAKHLITLILSTNVFEFADNLLDSYENENTKDKEKSEPKITDEKAEDKPQYPVPEIDWENDKPNGDDWNPPKNPNENWTRKNPIESLRKDKQHGPPIGPHWDWKDPGKINWRIFPDGRVLRKYPGTNK